MTTKTINRKVPAEVSKEQLFKDVVNKYGKNFGAGFKKIFDEWMPEKSDDSFFSPYELVAYKIDTGNARIITVTRGKRGSSSNDSDYSVHRFFMIGEKWEVSVDCAGDEFEVIKFLLHNL